MQLFSFNRICFVLASFVAASLGAQESSKMQQSKSWETHSNDKRKDLNKCQDFCNVSADRSYAFFVEGSFLYWQPMQENMKLGIVSNDSDSLDLVNSYDLDLDPTYKPGFKVGAGMSFDSGSWESSVAYTWFRSKETLQKTLDATNTDINILPAWTIPSFLSPNYHSATEKWTVRMQLIDLDFSKNFCSQSMLSFQPFVGVRCALIKQNLEADYINENASYLLTWPSTHITQSTNSWGVGPRAGIGSTWSLGKGFRIFGDGGFDLLFTQYDLKSSQTSSVTVANRYIENQSNVNTLRTHVDIGFGLGWEKCFMNKCLLDLSASYNFQAFFDQNMFRIITSEETPGQSFFPNGNLYIQGLTVSLGFDF